jgi:hypothetical protein
MVLVPPSTTVPFQKGTRDVLHQYKEKRIYLLSQTRQSSSSPWSISLPLPQNRRRPSCLPGRQGPSDPRSLISDSGGRLFHPPFDDRSARPVFSAIGAPRRRCGLVPSPPASHQTGSDAKKTSSVFSMKKSYCSVQELSCQQKKQIKRQRVDNPKCPSRASAILPIRSAISNESLLCAAPADPIRRRIH